MATNIGSDVMLANNTVGEHDAFWNQIPWVHPYWKQFDIPQLPDYYHFLVGMYMTFVCPLGVIGNMVVVYIFLKAKHLRTPNNMLIVNLAVSDMLFCAMNGFPILTINSIYKIWTWGETWCTIYGFNGGLMGFVSISTLAFIAFDRFFVISRPMQAMRSVTKKKTGMYIIFIWIYSLIWAAPPLFGWGSYNLEGMMTSCTFDYLSQDVKNGSFNMGMFFFAFAIPVACIFAFYIGIVKAVMAHHDAMNEQAKKMGAKTGDHEKERAVEIQMAKVGATSIGLFLASWLPYATVTAMGMLYPHASMMVTPMWSEVPVMLAKTSGIWNPLVYAISHPKFRAEVDKTFPWLLCFCMPKQEQAASNKTKGEMTSATVSKTEVATIEATETNPV